MTERDGGETFVYVIILAIIIVGLVVQVQSNDPRIVNASKTEVYEIRVPESFGPVVSMASDATNGGIVILFENGYYRDYIVERDSPIKIVWEES